MNYHNTFLKIGLFVFSMVMLSVSGISQWQPINVPNYDNLRDLEFYNGKLYALSMNAVYRSNNYGANWEVVFQNPGTTWDSKLFVEDGELFVVWEGQGVYKLQENGTDITALPWFGTVEVDYIYHNGSHFYMDYQSYVFRDGQPVLIIPQGGYGFFKSYEDELWIGSEHGIFRTSDMGSTWDTFQPNWDVTALDVYGDTIFVGMSDNKCRRSYDGGQTWSNMSQMNNISQPIGFKIIDGKLYGLSALLYVSQNMGNSWASICQEYTLGDLFKVGSLLVTPTSSGCLRSINNGSFWYYSNAGLLSDGSSGTYFKLSKQGNSLGATSTYTTGGSADPAYFSTSKGVTWKRPVLNPDWELDDLTFHQGNYYAYDIFEDLFFKSQFDVGGPWSVVNTVGFPPFALGFLSTNDGLYAWDNNKLYVSINSGQNWTPSFNLPGNITSDYICYHNDQMFTSLSGSILRSADYGANWTPLLQDGLPAGDSYTLENMESRAGTLYVHTNGGVFLKSIDEGDHWEVIDNGLQGLLAGSYIYDAIVSEAGILIDNTTDLFFSPDFGQTWMLFTDNMPDIYTVGGVATADAFYIAGYDGSLWRRDFSTAYLSNAAGKVYYDANASGNYDNGEQGLPDALLFTHDENSYVASDSVGDYTVYAQSFNADTVFLHLPSPYLTVDPSFHQLNDGATDLDFGINFIPGIKDLSVTLTAAGSIRPGFFTQFILTLANNGTATQNGQLTLEMNDQLEVVSTTPDSISFLNSVLTWDFDNLLPFARLNYLVEIYTPIDVQLGENMAFLATAGPVQDDATPEDNLYFLNLEVVGSYDPNYKEVRPAGLTPTMIQDSTALEYTVHFQNVGSYPASFVEIQDTISSNLDLSTLQILSASHDYTWELRQGRVLNLHFDNINLPDSISNEAASHGFVKYAIRPLRSLVLGDQIDNTAYIYFDFNSPVITNTSTIKVSQTLATEDETALSFQLSVSPNPSTRRLVLSVPNHGALGSHGKVTIYSAQGVAVYVGHYKGNEPLDITAFAPGVYFLGLNIDGQLYNGQFVKI